MKRVVRVFAVAFLLLLIMATLSSGEKEIRDQHTLINAQPTEQAQSAVQISTVETALPPPPAEADAYDIPWQSVNAGGEDMQSSNYRILSSVGQSAIGFVSSTSYSHGIGYWYGMAPGGDCFCGNAVGDANCDDAVNPVDVVFMVNFVYKNLDARCYPSGWNCPYDLGDVNCDTAVNPVDIVYYVNYVYRNLDAFCDPCVD